MLRLLPRLKNTPRKKTDDSVHWPLCSNSLMPKINAQIFVLNSHNHTYQVFIVLCLAVACILASPVPEKETPEKQLQNIFEIVAQLVRLGL